MIEGVYKWIGLVVGGLCALLATGALIQELRSSPDPGSVAFDLVFGAISAAVAARSGYNLFRGGRGEVSGGCLVITVVFGGVLLLATETILSNRISKV